MADYDILTFTPHNGGQGVRLTVTAVASVPVGIPCPSRDDSESPIRIRVANLGSVAASINLFGTASLTNMAILPGTVEMFGIAPNSGLAISAITEAGETTLSVVAGIGT
ncbi:MAG: hypothetical protein K0R61_57 [Microvirga sp.]|jgi:hypothetical protein|nr:hypothetical protein [Microvirga sp.]MDF2969607.1 hypothetical protein [Microvirga sp.]